MDIRIVNTKNRIQSGLIVAINSMPLYKIKYKDIKKHRYRHLVITNIILIKVKCYGI